MDNQCEVCFDEYHQLRRTVPAAIDRHPRIRINAIDVVHRVSE